MSGERVHLDVQSALLYPASRSRSATRRSMQRRQSPPAAGRPVQEQAAPAAARMLLTAASVSARILLSAGLLLARASCIIHIHAHLHRSAPEDTTTRLGPRKTTGHKKINPKVVDSLCGRGGGAANELQFISNSSCSNQKKNICSILTIGMRDRLPNQMEGGEDLHAAGCVGSARRPCSRRRRRRRSPPRRRPSPATAPSRSPRRSPAPCSTSSSRRPSPPPSPWRLVCAVVWFLLFCGCPTDTGPPFLFVRNGALRLGRPGAGRRSSSNIAGSVRDVANGQWLAAAGHRRVGPQGVDEAIGAGLLAGPREQHGSTSGTKPDSMRSTWNRTVCKARQWFRGIRKNRAREGF
jgi:hypothetical protein